jgi:hypothetical protein
MNNFLSGQPVTGSVDGIQYLIFMAGCLSIPVSFVLWILWLLTDWNIMKLLDKKIYKKVEDFIINLPLYLVIFIIICVCSYFVIGITDFLFNAT